MNRSRYFLALVVALLVAACNPIYVSHDYDPDVDFSQFHSYSWMELPQTTSSNTAEMRQSSPLFAKRIRAAIDEQLAGKGLSHVDDGGDLRVIYYLGAKQMVDVTQRAYSGADIWANARVGGEISVTDITEGTIIIDLVDGDADRLVWRGMAENAHRDDASTEQLNDTINKAIAKVFKKYPPK